MAARFPGSSENLRLLQRALDLLASDDADSDRELLEMCKRAVREAQQQEQPTAKRPRQPSHVAGGPAWTSASSAAAALVAGTSFHPARPLAGGSASSRQHAASGAASTYAQPQSHRQQVESGNAVEGPVSGGPLGQSTPSQASASASQAGRGSVSLHPRSGQATRGGSARGFGARFDKAGLKRRPAGR
eukprot:TRINITY_DN1451_c0_g1_i1.p1 TRINITY_DN1451_c0_g1~~TRINITY_DN1451_c0_g1_i1.p1  ORF type:complete len:188 (-),score=22.25 TRINITY_DN1451_c0_g1_i1:1272-1835(-)